MTLPRGFECRDCDYYVLPLIVLPVLCPRCGGRLEVQDRLEPVSREADAEPNASKLREVKDA